VPVIQAVKNPKTNGFPGDGELFPTLLSAGLVEIVEVAVPLALTGAGIPPAAARSPQKTWVSSTPGRSTAEW
jgi:hypothetical protein